MDQPQTKSPPPPSTLDSLISHLLSAKRSLSCFEDVSRANDLIKSARSNFAEETVLLASTSYLSQSCQSQCTLLSQIHANAASILSDTESELDDVVSRLDRAEAELRSTIDALKSTAVDARISADGTNANGKTLVDFIDDSEVNGLMNAIKDTLDDTRSSRTYFTESIRTLSTAVQDVDSRLVSSKNYIATNYGRKESISNRLHDMESSVSEMGTGLSSLVSHFDLCVTALRHTDGGSAHVQALSNENLPEDVAGEIEAQLEPVSEDERRELFAVIHNDAPQVDVVVSDIHRELEHIVSHTSQIASQMDRSRKFSMSIHDAAGVLLNVSNSILPTYQDASLSFIEAWDVAKERLASYEDGLASYSKIFAGFRSSYDSLLAEIERRANVEMKMARLRDDALGKLERLRNEDEDLRERFRTEQGQFLPSDLWKGILDRPSVWEWRRVA